MTPLGADEEICKPMTELCVVWIGDATLAERYLARRASQIRILSSKGLDAAGVLQMAVSSRPSPDLLVIDTTLPDCDPLEILPLAKSHGFDLPVVLITPLSGNEELAQKVARLAVCDCVVKTQDFVYQLLPAFAQVRARHDLQSVFRTLRDSEEHLRLVLEMQPAVVFTMDVEARVVAMNRAGLSLLSAGREKVVGQPFTAFLPEADHTELVNLVSRVAAGEAGELDHSITVADGEQRRVRTHVVPLARETGNVALATLIPAVDSGPVEDLSGEVARLMLAAGDALVELEAVRAEGQAIESRWAAAHQAAEDAHLRAIEQHDRERSQAVSALEARLRELEAELGQVAESHQRAEAERAELAERERSFIDDLAARERTLNDEFARQRSLNDELAAREQALTDALAGKERLLAEAHREAEARQASMASTIGGLETLRNQLSAQLADAHAQSSSAGVECARLASELDAVRGDAATIRSREDSIRNTFAEREQAFRDELASMEQMLAEAHREAEARQTSMASTVRELEALRDQLSAELGQVAQRAEAERAELAERERSFIDDLAARERTLNDEFARQRSMNDALAAREQALTDALAGKEHMLAEAHGEAQARQASMASTIGYLEALRDQLSAQLADALAGKEQMLAEAGREAEARQANMASTIGDLEALRDRLTAQLADAHAQSSSATAESVRIASELDAARSEADAIRSREEEVQQTLAEAHREADVRQTSMASTIGDLEALRDQLSAELRQVAQRAEAERAELADREQSFIDDLAARERTLNEEFVRLSQALAEAESRHTHMASTIGDLEALRDRLSAELTEARAQSSSGSADSARIASELDAARSHAEAIRGREKEVQQRLAEAQREAEARQASMASTIGDLEAVRDRLATELTEARALSSSVSAESARIASELDAARSDAEAIRSREQGVRNMLAEREQAFKDQLAGKAETLDTVLREAETRQATMASTISSLEALRDQLSLELAEARAQSSGASAESARIASELEAARIHAQTILGRAESDRQALVEREQALAERERTLIAEYAAREAALIDDYAARERTLADETRAKERELTDALTSRSETATDEARRDLYELREMLLELVFEADQRYRTPRGQRPATPGEADDTRRQTFLSFPVKDRSRPTSGPRSR